MSFIIVELWNVELIKKIWFFITNICRIKFRMIFELINATIFWFRFWNLINNDVQTCLNLFFFIRIVKMWNFFNDFKNFFFWFETNIFVMLFFLTIIANYVRQISFIFSIFCFVFIQKFFVRIRNCVEAIFNWIKFILFSFFEIFIVWIFETFFAKMNKFFFNIFDHENRFFDSFSTEHIDISST